MDATANPTSLSVLVVDDEPGIRELLEHWLARSGYRVICAHCGDAAMRLLETTHFDLVITDIVMPDGDGFELIGSIRRQQPRARVLAISGGGKYLQSADCLKMARGLGAHGCIMKPFKWEQMRQAVEAVMQVGTPAMA